MRRLLLAVLALTLVEGRAGAATTPKEPDTALVQAVYGPQRTPSFEARDASRHPVEELTFFGIKPTDTVVEIWPFGGYWTEILAPYLQDHGQYYLAQQPVGALPPEDKVLAALKAKLAASPVYSKVQFATFGKDSYDIAPAGTVDMVVTFRNLHNWMRGHYAEESLKAFYKALKPGGILGIEDHRARPTKPQDPEAKSGYVRQDYAIALAKKAGFVLVGSSEMDANPKDTTDWPKGVWTLPPTYAMGQEDRAKYEAVGEADNFVLAFRKPMH